MRFQSGDSETFEVSETSKVSETSDWKRKKRKARQGPTAKPWNYPNAQAVLEEIGKAAPAYAGMRWETLGEAGVQWPSAAMARIARKPEGTEIAPLAAPAAGSFYLVSGSLLWDGGAVMQHAAEQVRGLIPQPFVALAPADLAALKLVEGSAVVVSAPSRNVSLTLKADASVQPGTAWVPSGQPGFPAETLGAGRGEPVPVKVQVAG